MYSYLILILGSSLLYFSRNIIRNNYQLVKFRKINFKSLKILIQLFLKVIYILIIQKFSKNLNKIKKNTYDLSYSVNGKLFKYRFKIEKGPPKILQIIDHNNNDVTSKIAPYSGPLGNFHQIQYTPADFKAIELTFNLFNGEVLTFKENEIIELKL